MRSIVLALIADLIVCVLAASYAETPLAPIQVKVAPLYDFAGPDVHVGPFSEGLASSDKARLVRTVMEMKGRFDELSAESMYVAAIRLYDFGLRDAAVYWFYSAQYRAALLEALLVGSRKVSPELAAAKAFHESAGPTINGYAFCDRQKLTDTLGLVVKEQEEAPDMTKIYPRLPMLPALYWKPVNLRVAQGFRELSETVDARWEEIQMKRVQKGMNQRYCP